MLRHTGRATVIAGCLAAFVAGMGCSRSESGRAPGDKSRGLLHGRVKFEGAPPQMPELQRHFEGKPRDPACASHERARYVELKDGGVKDAVVRLAVGSVKGAAPPPAARPPVVDQRNCLYLPHVTAVREGQKVAFRNSDKTVHNVHGFVGDADRANDVQMPGAKEILQDPGGAGDEPYLIKCDVHPWMEAHVLVTDHPHFAVTSTDGSFTMDNVPPGTYTLQAWHPHLGTKTAQVTVAAGQGLRVELPAYQPSDYKAPR